MNHSAHDLTPLERRVISLLIDLAPSAQAPLRVQASQLRVSHRERLPESFSTTFESAASVDLLAEPRNFQLTGVLGVHATLSNGIDFVLFVRQGRIAWLEGSTYGGLWPRDEEAIELRAHPLAPE